MKTSITLRKESFGKYRVVSLTNRIDPEVRTILTSAKVESLITEANRIHSTLIVNIKE